MLCFALRKHKTALLPCASFEVEETVEAVADAFTQHYLSIGRPLTATSQTIAELLLGYYRLDTQTQKILCKLDTRDDKARIDFSFAEQVELERPLEMDTTLKVTMNGKATVYTDLKSDFEAQRVDFPDDEWKGGFTANAREPAKKAARSQSSGDVAAISATSPAKGSSNSVLSSALRKRLVEKTPEKKDGR